MKLISVVVFLVLFCRRPRRTKLYTVYTFKVEIALRFVMRKRLQFEFLYQLSKNKFIHCLCYVISKGNEICISLHYNAVCDIM